MDPDRNKGRACACGADLSEPFSRMHHHCRFTDAAERRQASASSAAEKPEVSGSGNLSRCTHDGPGLPDCLVCNPDIDELERRANDRMTADGFQRRHMQMVIARLRELERRPPQPSTDETVLAAQDKSLSTYKPEGLHQHYKGGLYRVLFVARMSEDHETEVVVYVSLTHGAIWVRPLIEWVQLVHWASGETLPRYVPVEVECG